MVSQKPTIRPMTAMMAMKRRRAWATLSTCQVFHQKLCSGAGSSTGTFSPSGWEWMCVCSDMERVLERSPDCFPAGGSATRMSLLQERRLTSLERARPAAPRPDKQREARGLDEKVLESDDQISGWRDGVGLHAGQVPAVLPQGRQQEDNGHWSELRDGCAVEMGLLPGCDGCEVALGQGLVATWLFHLRGHPGRVCVSPGTSLATAAATSLFSGLTGRGNLAATLGGRDTTAGPPTAA